jgi:hypothetical protein
MVEPYPYQLFFVVRKTRAADLVAWIRANPDRASKLGLDHAIESERVKLSTVPQPNTGETVVALAVSSRISEKQRDFWIQVKTRVPAGWANDVDGAIRSNDNPLDFDEWLAGLSTPLYRQGPIDIG